MQKISFGLKKNLEIWELGVICYFTLMKHEILELHQEGFTVLQQLEAVQDLKTDTTRLLNMCLMNLKIILIND